MKFRPLHDVSCQTVDAKEKTAGGIIIRMRQGEALAGRNHAWAQWPRRGRQADSDILKLRRVLFASVRQRGQARRQELLIMKESDIMGVSHRRPRRQEKPHKRFARPLHLRAAQPAS